MPGHKVIAQSYLSIGGVKRYPVGIYLSKKTRNMKTYETVTILKPQATDAEVAAFVEKAKAFISSSGGEIVSEEKLGRRIFTHDIAKNREGFYLYLKFNAAPNFVKTWTNDMKLNQNVLRSIVMLSIEPKNKPSKKSKVENSATAAA
ncbi:MAG: 30S ribosomal protein S6 [Elusimicrobiota bacterium]|jgi:small subunit ribosomal protein S6|nr:30S ribosomal protein S6 [Elusimicrobiota bacterium]